MGQGRCADQLLAGAGNSRDPRRVRVGRECFARVVNSSHHRSDPAEFRMRKRIRIERKPPWNELGDLPTLLVLAKDSGTSTPDSPTAVMKARTPGVASVHGFRTVDPTRTTTPLVLPPLSTSSSFTAVRLVLERRLSESRPRQ